MGQLCLNAIHTADEIQGYLDDLDTDLSSDSSISIDDSNSKSESIEEEDLFADTTANISSRSRVTTAFSKTVVMQMWLVLRHPHPRQNHKLLQHHQFLIYHPHLMVVIWNQALHQIIVL